MRKRFTLLKAVTKGMIDFCVVPGAAIGAEILWLYSMQWKTRISLFALAVISFIYSNMQLVIADQLSANNFNGPENIR
jgi:hypothetical protein